MVTKLHDSLNQDRFQAGKMDHSLFIYKDSNTYITTLKYVDHVIIAGNNLEKIQQKKDYLNEKFSIKDLGS